MKKLTLTITFILSCYGSCLFSDDQVDPKKATIEGMFYFNKATLELDDKKGDLNQAKFYLDKALEIFKKHNNEDFLANTYVKQADIYFRIHQIEHAQLCLEQASMLKIQKRTALSLALAQTKLERLKGNKDLALTNALNAEKLALFVGNNNQIKRIQKLIQILQDSKYKEVIYR